MIMPNNSSGPTILVKKKDGTQVRMTWEEFAVYKKSLGSGEAEPQNPTEPVAEKPRDYSESEKHGIIEPEKEIVKKVVEPEKTKTSEKILPLETEKNKISKNGETHLATSTPVRDIFVDEAVASKKKKAEPAVRAWTRDDHASPLEDKENISRYAGSSLLPGARTGQGPKVLSKLNFKIPEELRGRFDSLVESYLKGIRTASQIEDYATREVANGGLGLLESQAREFLLAMREELVYEAEPVRRPGVEELKKEKTPIVSLPERKTLFRNDSIQPPREARPIMHDVVAGKEKIVTDQQVSEPVAKIVEVKRGVGPEEELQTMTLQDFRLLADDPVYGAEALLARIRVLKNYSFMAYQQGLQAWYNSPLYQDYCRVLSQAIGSKKKLEEVLPNEKKEGLTRDEFLSLMEMMKNLEM